MKLSPLRQFVLAAMLWLPASFFLWAVFASVLVWPIAHLSDAILTAWMPDVFSAVEQVGVGLEIVTRLQTAGTGERIGVLVLSCNPLIYAWCLALFFGLVMPTPLSGRQRLVQLAIGLPVLLLTTTWGVVFEAFKLLSFDAGALGAAAVGRSGLSADAIALGYQFGYLILPAVTPITLWVLQNSRFLEQLVGWRGEPEADDAGHNRIADVTTPSTKDAP